MRGAKGTQLRWREEREEGKGGKKGGLKLSTLYYAHAAHR